jgi:hypothetical protein
VSFPLSTAWASIADFDWNSQITDEAGIKSIKQTMLIDKQAPVIKAELRQ